MRGRHDHPGGVPRAVAIEDVEHWERVPDEEAHCSVRHEEGVSGAEEDGRGEVGLVGPLPKGEGVEEEVGEHKDDEGDVGE